MRGSLEARELGSGPGGPMGCPWRSLMGGLGPRWDPVIPWGVPEGTWWEPGSSLAATKGIPREVCGVPDGYLGCPWEFLGSRMDA